LLREYAWCRPATDGRARPVGLLRPNDFGLFDMYGNAFQWCQESAWDYRPGENGRPAEDAADQRDIDDRIFRALRGGSFDDDPRNLLSARRHSLRPSYRGADVGLRVARTCD
jgi:formylglycine-generating enzyme required for sulfatase activity